MFYFYINKKRILILVGFGSSRKYQLTNKPGSVHSVSKPGCLSSEALQHPAKYRTAVSYSAGNSGTNPPFEFLAGAQVPIPRPRALEKHRRVLGRRSSPLETHALSQDYLPPSPAKLSRASPRPNTPSLAPGTSPSSCPRDVSPSPSTNQRPPPPTGVSVAPLLKTQPTSPPLSRLQAADHAHP